jgi:hypothetical protein
MSEKEEGRARLCLISLLGLCVCVLESAREGEESR